MSRISREFSGPRGFVAHERAWSRTRENLWALNAPIQSEAVIEVAESDFDSENHKRLLMCASWGSLAFRIFVLFVDTAASHRAPLIEPLQGPSIEPLQGTSIGGLDQRRPMWSRGCIRRLPLRLALVREREDIWVSGHTCRFLQIQTIPLSGVHKMFSSELEAHWEVNQCSRV